jgi:polyhydroxyalkanoate synthase
MRYPIEKLLQNFSIIIDKYFKIYKKLIDRVPENNNFSADPLQLNQLMVKLFNNVMSDPDRIIKYQMSFFKGQLETIEEICSRYYQSSSPKESSNANKDKRFKNILWEEHCAFAWLKDAYFTYAKWLDSVILELPRDDFTALEFRRLNFIIKQFLDAIAPSNFPNTNPEVVHSFFDSAGENFIKGLDNLMNDIENSRNSLQIKNNDSSKFNVGENIAISEGKIVYQNKLIQLIHYKPLRAENYSVPMLIISPFINKYYVMDMQPENSLVKWLLEQGHNVFMISWTNPNESLKEHDFSDYMLDGPLSALDYLSNSLGIEQVNALGYCIGGTLLAATLSYMKSNNDKRIKTASFLTTLIDFEEAGDLSIFVDDCFIKEVARHMQASGGYLDGNDLALTFNLLRSNDMIWPFYINNYLLGKDSFPFDLLYWNSDSTRLPMKLHLFYLKNMYKDNLLKIPGGITINEREIDISLIDIPCFAMAAKGDHIVPWKNAFNSAKLFSGPTNFILAESGHVAGVINHPNNNKYSYWQNSENFKTFSCHENWLESADERSGSWWIYWQEWLKDHSGKLIQAQDPEEVNPHIIESAPGSYVKIRY